MSEYERFLFSGKPGMVEVDRNRNSESGEIFSFCISALSGESATYRIERGGAPELGHYFGSGRVLDAMNDYLERLGAGRSLQALRARGWLVVAFSPDELPEGLSGKDRRDIEDQLVASVAARVGYSPCVRCGGRLEEGLCQDETCPFSEYPQDDDRGWAGHAER